MPVYAFVCTKCDKCFESFVHSLEKTKEVTCPDCGGKKLRRLLSNFSCPSGDGPAGARPAGEAPG